MATPIMIQCRLTGQDNTGNVIDIQGNSVKPGTLLDAFPQKVWPSLNSGPAIFAANQTWEVLPDPAGSHHFIIQNPGSLNCIDIQGNSTTPGASLDAYTKKTEENQNQLWDFIPDPFGSPYFFIQNPQTGYVIEIQKGSSKSGALLVVNPRRLFDNNFQLWAGVQEDWGAATFPALTLAQPTAVLKDTANYVLLPADQTKFVKAVTVSLDIIEDLVADSFSVQINGNSPYPPPAGVTWDAAWMQFWLLMANNSLSLGTQVWHNQGPDPPGNPLASQPAGSASMLTLENNTIPAGTRIVLSLTIDPSNDYVTGISGKAFNQSGSPIGHPQSVSVVGQPTFNPGGPVKESDLAPYGSFQAVIVGAPGGHAHFNSGLGTMTVNCSPNLSPQLYWPNPDGGGTAETSNVYYGKVQEGNFSQIVQPFGLPSPKFTSVTGDYDLGGTGLLPNSILTAKAVFQDSTSGATVTGNIAPAPLTTQSDGSFSVAVTPQNATVLYESGTLSTTVTDADGNWVSAVVPLDVQSPTLTSTSGLHT
jgi:hypothetical protein